MVQLLFTFVTFLSHLSRISWLLRVWQDGWHRFQVEIWAVWLPCSLNQFVVFVKKKNWDVLSYFWSEHSKLTVFHSLISCIFIQASKNNFAHSWNSWLNHSHSAELWKCKRNMCYSLKAMHQASCAVSSDWENKIPSCHWFCRLLPMFLRAQIPCLHWHWEDYR